jgi:hypothetical protein
MMAERASVHGSLHRYQDGSVIRSANLGSKHLSGNQKMQMYLDTRFGQSAMQMHLEFWTQNKPPLGFICSSVRIQTYKTLQISDPAPYITCQCSFIRLYDDTVGCEM